MSFGLVSTRSTIGAFEDVHFWALERAKRRTVNHVSFPVVLPEDLVILKAQAAVAPQRGEKSPRDKAAIKAIAKENDLDTDYIETILTQAQADCGDEYKLLKELGVLS